MESFCQRCTCKCDFSCMTSSVWLVRLEYLEKSLRYALEHWTGNLRSKFDPIPTNTDRVLSICVLSELESMVYSLECNREAQQRHYDAIVV